MLCAEDELAPMRNQKTYSSMIMGDQSHELFASDVADGLLRKGFFVVSQSNDWVPWMVWPVQHRIEIGLFEEYLACPNSPAFSLNWIVTDDETRVEVRAPAAAWLILPLLDGLVDVIAQLGASVDADALGTAEVSAMLVNAGFAESKWDYPEVGELPLPPEEPVLPSAPALSLAHRSSGTPCGDEVRWVGPHIGRTSRFFGLVDKFIADLNAEGVAAQDIKQEYTDSAFNRLWECIDYSQIGDRLLAASGRSSELDVPIALTDTKAYLATAVWKGEEAFVRSGGYEGAPDLTLLVPISQIAFQLYETKADDLQRIEAAFEKTASGMGLKVDWDDRTPIVRLPDTPLYRDHAIQP